MPNIGPSDKMRRQLMETTVLSPDDEKKFQKWAKDNQIGDVNDPRSFYDYRGFWKSTGGKPRTESHFVDTYKQFGHPTFSQESKYSIGPSEGGMWLNDLFVPQPKMMR